MTGLITTTAQYRELLLDILALTGDDVYAIDTETTGLNLYSGDVLRGVSLAYEKDGAVKGWYLSISHPDSINMPGGPLREALERCWATPLYHNAPFDWASLERGLGLAPPQGSGSYVDTQVVAWLMDENGRTGLKPLAARIWGEDEKAEANHIKALKKGRTIGDVYREMRAELKAQGVKESAAGTKERARAAAEASKKDWPTFTAEDIAAYAIKDTELTLRLYHWQREQEEYARIEPAIDPKLRMQEAIHRMARRGVQVDIGRIATTRLKYLAQMEAIKADPLLGGANLGSPQQLSRLIYETWGLPVLERTKKGAPSTSKDALDLLAGQNAGLDLILEYRKLQKAVATYFDALLELADDNGRVHASLNLTGTVTGRFSCSRPNLQNIPRSGTNPDVTEVFVAAEGYELWSFDMSQAELRIAASLADEPAMLDKFAAGIDIYQGTADDVYRCDDSCGRDEKGHCKTHRQPSKTVVLASGYGIGARKLARGLLKGTGRLPVECLYWLLPQEERWELDRCETCDSCQAKQLLDSYWGSVPELKAMNRKLIKFAEKRGFVPLHKPGRFRHYPTVKECVDRKIFNFPKAYTAMNSVVQGGCAELVQSWIMASEKPLAKLGARMVLTVHDSVVVELLPGTKGDVQRALQSALNLVTPKGWIEVPLESKQGV